MRKSSGVALLILAVVIAVLAVNALRLRSRQVEAAANDEVVPPIAAAAQRLAQAVRFRTISTQQASSFVGAEFDHFRAFLAARYPRVGSALRKHLINGYSLLYEWPGTDASLKPVLLMAHQDVVPVDPATADQWLQAPFGGVLAGEFIWGRGTLDDKGAVMALHEAAETLLAQGFRPGRTVYFAFGHDEEVGGRQGSLKIAEWLASEGVRLESVLDEGQVVTEGIIAGTDKPVALIGIAEKGYLSLEFVVEMEGGHSSMPPPQTAVGVLSAAIARLESNPFQPTLTEPVRSQLAYLGPEQGWLRRTMFANLWLFAPLVKLQMAKTPATNAMVRTTIAPTMLEGSIKENVLPARARAVVNLRLLPGTSSDEAIRRVVAAVDDARVNIVATGTSLSEPSPVSSTDSEAFKKLQRAVKSTFPDAIVVPSLVLGATDSRYFTALADNVFRFLPARFAREDLSRYHGINERVSDAHYTEFIRFYMRYLREAAG
ncbi:MAG: M20 family peptidase [Burkholderiales bacterium]